MNSWKVEPGIFIFFVEIEILLYIYSLRKERNKLVCKIFKQRGNEII